MNGSGDPTDYLACYDNETKIMTDEGWKYFWELDGGERVMVLDPETGEQGWEVPMEYQRFEYDGKMYEIETKEGNLLVSPEHKIYVKRVVEDEEEILVISIIKKMLNLGGGLFRLLIYVS